MLKEICSFVGDKVSEAVSLLGGVHKEVEEINEDLETIQLFINDADRMVATTEQQNKGDIGMKRKVKKLREAYLRIEEVTEDYIITQQQQQQQPHDSGCAFIFHAAANFIKTMFLRLRVSYEIRDIKTSILQIREGSGLQVQSFLEQGSSSGSQNVLSQHALRRNALYVEEDDVVGFEAPKHELIGWLNETQPKRTAIIVVGMGGQGKTTLAKTVYDKVIGDFDCHAWITVSQTYNIQDLLKTMLKKFGGMNDSEMDLESLINEVREYLSQRRYVVFFDDVWSKDFWSEIESSVLDHKNRSRVVITTRDMEVANFCKKSSFHIHNLQCLSPQESMKLFCKKAFQNKPDGICPTGFEETSSEIVEKCKGLPLAIIAIGSLIACNEKNSFELKKFCKDLIYELDKNPNSTSITNILGLSYDALSFRLKSCFMYFGIYPEDYEVEPERLIRHWIAEGFVKSDERHETLEEIGEQYLKELIQRSLVQVSSFYIDGKPKRCRVHDLLRDMILLKIKDLGFCHFLGDDHSMISGKILRLQITNDSNVDHLKDGIETSFIRSIHIFGNKELPEDFLEIILTKCRRLKLIDFEGCHLDYIPQNLGNLIHLRYLSFCTNNEKLKSLLESICNLQNLETLSLRGAGFRLLPREINKLQKLRHLMTDWPVKMMGGVKGLDSLQKLYCVDIENWGEELFEELKELKQLRSLALWHANPKYVCNLCDSINNMQHLQKLSIEVHESYDGFIHLDCISPLPTLQKLELRGKLERFEEWIPKHRNLVKLNLLCSKLSDDPIKSLMHLPNLLSLLLWDAYEGETLNFQNRMFQKLKKLHLHNMKNLNSIHIGEGALSSVKELRLANMPKLKEVFYGIDQLGKLQVLEVYWRMAEEFCDSIRENVWIQNNVPTVFIECLE